MNSSDRIIDILMRMLWGEKVDVDNVETMYEVSERTVKRDLSTIRNNNIFSKEHELHYNAAQKNYYVTSKGTISSEEALAILDILASSQALTEIELKLITSKLLRLVATDERSKIKALLTTANEDYQTVADKNVFPLVRKFSDWIITKREIAFEYDDGVTKILHEQSGVPLSMYFDDHHFQVLMYLIDEDMTVLYQLDYFKKLRLKKRSINVPANKRLDIGQLIKNKYRLYPDKEKTGY